MLSGKTVGLFIGIFFINVCFISFIQTSRVKCSQLIVEIKTYYYYLFIIEFLETNFVNDKGKWNE